MNTLRPVWAAIVSAAVCIPSIAAADTVAAIVRPLREIGHVRATSAFCAGFSKGATPAITGSLAFENRLAITGADLQSFDNSSELSKYRTSRVLFDDLRALADDALAGRTELSALREKALASGTDADQAVVEFADALSGAQGRQLFLARHIARIVGTLAETPVNSIVDGPLDVHHGDPFSRFGRSRSALLADPVIGFDETRYENGFFTLPGDEEVGRDLARGRPRARCGIAGELSLALAVCGAACASCSQKCHKRNRCIRNDRGR